MSITRCKVCVLPHSAVEANGDGVCKLCASYEETIAWEKLEDDFREISDKLKKKGRPFDCMVPLTGGKDSSFIVHYTRNVCDLNPLAFTWDNGLIRDAAWKNIYHALARTGIDHEIVAFEPELWQRFLRATFREIEKVCFCPLFMLFTAIPVAVKHKIPAIITGFSEGQRGLDHNYGLPDLGDNLEEIRNFHDVWTTVFRETLLAQEDEETTERIMDNLFGPMEECLRNHTDPDEFPVIIPLSNYVSWLKRDELEETLISNLGWSKPSDSFVHTSCIIEPIKGYLEFTGGMNEIHHELSYLVRGGFMEREDAIHDLGAMNVTDQEPAEIDPFLDFIDIPKDEFRDIVKAGPKVKFLVDGVDNGRIQPGDILGTVAWCMGNKQQIVDYSPKAKEKE